MSFEDSIVIVSGARTPMGGFGGVFSGFSAIDLGAEAIKAAVAKSGIDSTDVDEVYMGCVLQAGLKHLQGKPLSRRVFLTLLGRLRLTKFVVQVCRPLFLLTTRFAWAVPE